MAKPQITPVAYANRLILTAVLLAYCATIILLIKNRLAFVPTPAPLDAPLDAFSEARARVHLHHLTVTIGNRQVSTPGNLAARNYVEAQLQKVKASAASRSDVSVEVVRTTVNGAVSMTFTKINFTNAYRSLDNLALVITPRGTEGKKAVLIASHYDSAVCSQGASDDGSQVTVMLETARALVHAQQLPPTPVVFLWTGGEEPISPAAHGWASTSPLYPRLGAFINLEAMGGGGLPIVFQHTGAWVLEAYARSAPGVRGSRVAQDIFDLHIIPADSDFRMFSARHYGSLPGLDVAYVVDSTAYHTYLDSYDRVRPGVIQEMGEGLLGGLMGVSKALAARQAAGKVGPPLFVTNEAGQAVPGQQEGRTGAVTPEEREAAFERAVYWDVLGYFMVTYADHVADTLHNVPLALILLMPLASSLLFPSSSSSPAASKAKKDAAPGTPAAASAAAAAAGGRGMFRSPAQVYVGVLGAAARTLCSIILAVAAPALLGAARTLISGTPMIWFAHQWVGSWIYIPISLAAALAPWLSISERAAAADAGRQGDFLAVQVCGCGLMSSLIAAGLSAAGLKGNAFIFALCGGMACLSVPLLAGPRLRPWALGAMLVAGLVPVSVGSSAVVVFVHVLMERMALSGHVSVVLADILIGVLFGAGVLATSAGVMLPLLAYGIAGQRKKVITGLVLVSVAAAAWSSTNLPAYTPTAPKRAIISHIVLTQPAAGSDTNAAAASEVSQAVAGGPPGGGIKMEITRDYVALGIVDSTPLDKVIGLTSFTPAANPWGRDFTPVFPLDDMILGVEVEVPPDWRQPQSGPPRHPYDIPHPTDPLLDHLPFVQLVAVQDLGQRYRLDLRMYSQLPCWGILNVTGPIVAWSFHATALSPSFINKDAGAGEVQHVVRFVTQDADPYWTFWVEVEKATVKTAAAAASSSSSGSRDYGVHFELSTSYLQRTNVLTSAMRHLPASMHETWLATVYQSEWHW
mmetsp:Transcript_32483/g.82526  ORF Transcript_32483/g.82526 Transcript_32483/m.82526 type:complete len:974 (-) Transcript_32483:185-3106(-)|eukprot:CAMPEP_0202859430 /NCGR_PEP_ID=MMETSP1391-20130828/1546_1 /ASSEMBLY_ACC=CAM_ASM_000867 /TAXON_ID=1034604 /ORGANISM="Chlamydomonas leiostraca, Strain SAG 11-49" /LENGTH=973 /DNA_ID=CAMNT_0049538463 /DNA_START=46 /DNA_END=2967 /DNA_ORIENTATION=-